MRNVVINCNVSVKDSFDEEKVKDAFMRLFIVTVNSDIKINGFRMNDIDDSVLEQIPPLSLKSILAGKHLIEARFLPWIKIMS